MRTFASITALLAFTLALAGCGGSDSGCNKLTGGTGGGSTTTSTCSAGTGTGATAATLTVSSSTASIPADGSASATVTVVAKDSANAVVSGAAVTFSSSAGNITVVQATTDSSGTATATLAAGTAAAGSTITVTATSGSASGHTDVMVANTQTTMTLLTSLPQIPSDNTTPAIITAFVRDASNNFVPGVVVHFQATSGGLVVNTPTGGSVAGTTDASGAATATLSVSGDPSTRAITVTATQGSSTADVVVNVVGTSVGVTGPDSLVLGNSSPYTVSLIDAGKKAISSQAVTVTSSAGNTLSATTITTDSSGHATFTLMATKAGTDTVTVTALGTSASQSIAISNQQFQFTAPVAAALIPISVPVAPATACTPNTPVTVSWQVSSVPVANNTAVNFASTRGTLSAGSAVTTGGNATVMICSTSAGPATLSASAPGVSANLNVSFVSNTPSTIDLQAGPSTVPITGQSTLTAIVRDAKGNLVQGQNVDFTLTDVSGGSLSLATATTDVEGVAQSVYTASNTASASNGVSVTATVHGTTISKTATLTVDGSPLHISLGTGNKLLENDNNTAFMMNWFVSVLDAAGHPVANTPITLTIHSASRPFYAYYKGAYVVCGNSWVQYDGNNPGSCAATPPVAPTPPTPCLNEDLNLTGLYDVVEDISRNGKLDPGDIALAVPGTLTTAADGTGNFQVIYPEDHGLWVQVTLTATASVQGTESSTSSTFVLPTLGAYLSDIKNSPPGAVSPYGTQTCTDPN